MATATSEMEKRRSIISQWFHKELWNWDLEGMDNVEGIANLIEIESFFKCLLIAANGDGELSPDERKWVIGHASTAGAPESLLKELESYSANEDISQVLSKASVVSKGRRAVIYFAIKAAASDGEYAEGEKATVRKMAQAIDISEEVVKEIEELCAEEERVRQKRIALCLPDGVPYN